MPFGKNKFCAYFEAWVGTYLSKKLILKKFFCRNVEYFQIVDVTRINGTKHQKKI